MMARPWQPFRRAHGLRSRPARGFTLVELLVAIGILAMVAVLGWRGLDSIIRARVVLTQQMEQSRGLQLAFAQMQADLDNLSGSSLLREHTNLDAGDGRLTLIRTVFAEQQAAQLEVVAYRVVNGVLTRRESRATRDLTALAASWTATVNDTDGATGVVLQDGVAGLSVRLWEGMNWRNAVSSGTSNGSGASTSQLALIQAGTASTATAAAAAAAAQSTGVPTGLEMSLQLRGQPVGMVKVFLLGGI
jgi:general secretion pathway protein J